MRVNFLTFPARKQFCFATERKIMDSEQKESENGQLVDINEKLASLMTLVELSAVKFDPRYVVRAFKEHTVIRRSVTANDLLQLISRVYPEGHSSVSSLNAALLPFKGETSMEIDELPRLELNEDASLPEIDVFIHLLVQIFLHDSGELKAFHQFNAGCIEILQSYNRRTLDFIQGKVWYYIFRSSELTGNLIPIRTALMAGLRTATLRHDIETRASIITLLLRDYILTNDINQAYNLVDKTEFPNEATNSVVARYYYYLARIHVIQLDYSSANECAITAIRKTPQTKSALGFLQSSTKLHIIIQLLTGEIPELSSFRDGDLEKSLIPYAAVTKAVRLGDLKIFNESLEQFKDILRKDKNYNLVLRLRQNVIKTGIRIISLTYKKISLKDICIKLQLENELSAEYIVSKAIADGVVDASIDHANGYMQSRDVLDVYSTAQPQVELDRRVKFTLQLNNEYVKAMKYPLSKNRVDGQADVAARAREQELIAYLQDDDF